MFNGPRGSEPTTSTNICGGLWWRLVLRKTYAFSKYSFTVFIVSKFQNREKTGNRVSGNQTKRPMYAVLRTRDTVRLINCPIATKSRNVDNILETREIEVDRIVDTDAFTTYIYSEYTDKERTLRTKYRE